MQTLFNIINIPLGFILDWISKLFGGNFAASVFVFTLVINLLMIPLTIKSQKSSVQQLRIKPKLDALKQKYGDDQRKYSQAMQELYSKEGVSMSGGCLPMLIRLPIMMSIYYLIRQPLQYLCRIPSDIIAAAKEQLISLGAFTESEFVKSGGDIIILRHADQLADNKIANAVAEFDFHFLGIDLTATPKFSMDIVNNADETWIIPLLAFLTAMLSSVISLAVQKKINPDAPNMAGMMLTMPIISLVIAFGLPCAIGFYWACSSLIGGILQGIIQSYYGPEMMIAKERSKEITKAYNDELSRIGKASDSDAQ